MIDTISVVFPCRHEPFGDQLLVTDADGVIKRRVRVQHIVAQEGSDIKITVTSQKEGTAIWATCSLARALQQHNVFGSNDLRALCPAFFDAVTQALDITPTEEDRLAWKRGEYWLRRVDIAEHFRLPTGVTARDVVRATAQRLLDRAASVSVYKGWETVYRNQHSRFESLKIYDKRRELSIAPLPEMLQERKKLLGRARRSIRAEVVLRSTKLGRLKGEDGLTLQHGRAWTASTARRLLYRALQKAKLTAGSVRAKEVRKDIPLRLRPVIRLWELGEDLNDLYHARSLQRHRKALAPLNVDPSVPPSKPACRHVKLDAILSRQRQFASCPKWAKGKRIFFNPKMRRK